MDKNYFKAIDNLTPSKSALDRAIEAARAEQSGKVIPMKTTKKKFGLIGAIAASLALIITLGAVFFPSSVSTDSGETNNDKSENIFFITANAAELENQISDKSVIGVFAGETGTARLADFDNNDDSDPFDSGQYYKDGYADLFILYGISTFSVKGDNIKSISMKSNKKGIYFGVTPVGDIDESRNGDENVNYVYTNGRAVAMGEKSYKEYEKSRKEKLKRYIDADSLNNSQYTKEELKKYGDGMYADIFCDEFTYENTDGKKIVDIGGDFDLVIESNHSNARIAKLLEKLDNVDGKIIEHKFRRENHDDLDSYRDNLYRKIVKETVMNATIDVTVNFADGTSQTKTLKLAYYMDKELYFPFLTLK